MQRIKNEIVSKKVYTVSVAVLILVSIIGCISFVMRPETRLELCWLIKGADGQVLDSYPNPDGSFVIHVVNPYCGQTSYLSTVYDCSIRLDLEFDDRIVRGPEMGGECDASITWLNNIQFEVTYQSGEKREMDIPGDFGIIP